NAGSSSAERMPAPRGSFRWQEKCHHSRSEVQAMHTVHSVSFSEFEWDERKRLRTLGERGIDFQDVAESLLRPHLEKRSDREGEVRILAICSATLRVIAVVY